MASLALYHLPGACEHPCFLMEQRKDFDQLCGTQDTNKVLAISRIMVAWQPVGLAAGVYDMVLRYMKEREQFNVPIAAFQVCLLDPHQLSCRLPSHSLNGVDHHMHYILVLPYVCFELQIPWYVNARVTALARSKLRNACISLTVSVI